MNTCVEDIFAFLKVTKVPVVKKKKWYVFRLCLAQKCVQCVWIVLCLELCTMCLDCAVSKTVYSVFGLLCPELCTMCLDCVVSGNVYLFSFSCVHNCEPILCCLLLDDPLFGLV